MSGRRRPKQPHNARSLGREVKVAYPFHPLFGRLAVVIADQIHNGDHHLKLSSGDDGQTFLVPAWMLEPETATIGIVDAPRLPVARLLELRAFLDSGLASDLRAGPEGGADVKAIGKHADGFVRTDASRQITAVATSAADEPSGADPNPVDRSNNNGARWKGEGR